MKSNVFLITLFAIGKCFQKLFNRVVLVNCARNHESILQCASKNNGRNK